MEIKLKPSEDVEKRLKGTSGLPRLAFSIHETAFMLGVCDKSVRRLIDRGMLKANKSLRHIRISKKEIERFLNGD